MSFDYHRASDEPVQMEEVEDIPLKYACSFS
jgi:hypothetical protein